ncbi:MAG: DUF3667 domain-containing protein [Betaproteobacteria bacterium]
MTKASAHHEREAPPRSCVNCGAAVAGAYCPACGQESDVRLPTLRQFMREAMGSLVSLDGRLWRTLRVMVTKPGFLTQEYLRGRRKYYVRPARLYLAASVLLFAVLKFTTVPFSFDDSVIKVDVPRPAVTPSGDAQPTGADVLSLGDTIAIGMDHELNFYVKGPKNAVTDQLRTRFDHFNKLSARDRGKQLVSGLLQYAPYAMFVLLPVFAWLQQVSYIGRVRRYPGRPKRYIEHLVYATHLHCVMFLAAALALLSPWDWLQWVILAWLVWFVLRGKHAVYGGSRWGGLARSLFVVVAYTAFMGAALFVLIFPAILLA